MNNDNIRGSCECYIVSKGDYPSIAIYCTKDAIFKIKIFSCLGVKEHSYCKKHMRIVVSWLAKHGYDFEVRRIN